MKENSSLMEILSSLSLNGKKLLVFMLSSTEATIDGYGVLMAASGFSKEDCLEAIQELSDRNLLETEEDENEQKAVIEARDRIIFFIKKEINIILKNDPDTNLDLVWSSFYPLVLMAKKELE